MLLIARKNQLLLSYSYADDRYVIAWYTGKILEESNNRAAIDAAWRRRTNR